MSAKLIWVKVFLLTVLSRSECFMYNNGGVMSWASVYNKMTTVSKDINLQSSCPWTIVREGFTSNYFPQLLRIREKEAKCKSCCIDLNQSNATHLIINPRGKCHELKVFVPCRSTRITVGYTCIYDASISTDKRNGGQGPIVNGGSRHLQTANTGPVEQTKVPNHNSIWDRKSSVNPPLGHTREVNFGGQNNIFQNNKYPVPLHQQSVPSFLNNAQFKNPPFLQSNNAQFRPGFLNEMKLQLRPQSMIPVVVHSQRNMDYDPKETDSKVTEHYDEMDTRNGENKDIKHAQEHVSPSLFIGK